MNFQSLMNKWAVIRCYQISNIDRWFGPDPSIDKPLSNE